MTPPSELDIAVGFVASFVVAYGVVKIFIACVGSNGLKPFGRCRWLDHRRCPRAWQASFTAEPEVVLRPHAFAAPHKDVWIALRK